MKKHFFLVFMFILDSVLTSCIKNTKIETTFFNKSELMIDSVVFEINNYSCKIVSIEPLQTAYIEINADSIKTNPHDVIVLASIYSDGKLLKEALSYSDLGGVPNTKYSLTLSNDLTAILK